MTDEMAQLLRTIRHVYPTSRLRPVGPADLAAIRAKYPGVPEHFLEFLRQVGAGGLGDGNFMIYGGLTEPSEVFDPETAGRLEGIVFFGDDLSGWLAGFDTRNGWRLVGVDSASPRPVPEPTGTVAEFFARWIG